MNSLSFFTGGFILSAVEGFNFTASAVLQRVYGGGIIPGGTLRLASAATSARE
jgi:hypothetical protein